MSSDDSNRLVAVAESSIESENYRDAVAALRRLERIDTDEQVKESAVELMDKITAAANPQLAKLTAAITANKNGEWADDFLEFRNQFEFAPCARELMQMHEELRLIHQEPARQNVFGGKKALSTKEKRGRLGQVPGNRRPILCVKPLRQIKKMDCQSRSQEKQRLNGEPNRFRAMSLRRPYLAKRNPENCQRASGGKKFR